MKKLMQYTIVACISFTFSCILYLIFSLLSIFPPFDEQLLITLLFISVGIMTLIYLTHLLPIEHPFAIRMLEIFVVIFVLFTAIKFFNMVPARSIYVLYVMAMGLIIYIIVNAVQFTANQADAEKINSAIRTQKKENT